MTDRNERVGQAFLLFGVSLFLVVSVGFAMQAIWPRAGLGLTEIFLILIPALWFVRRKDLPLRSSLRLTRVPGSTALLATAVGVAGWGVAVLIHGGLAGTLGAPPSTGAPRLTPEEWAALLLVGALLPGLCEEVLFRGAIMGVLERRGKWYAITVAAILFGVYHLNPTTVIPAVFLGLVFGLLVVRTGSLLPAILAHIANNATAIVVAQSGAAVLVPASILAAALLPLGLLFWMRTRDAPAPPTPLATVPAAAPVMTPLRVVGLTGIGLILGVSLLAVTILNVHWVQDADLEPDLGPGDLAIVAVDHSRERALRPGDIVEFDHAPPMMRSARRLGRVVEVHDARLTIETGEALSDVPRHGVVGKLVYSRRR